MNLKDLKSFLEEEKKASKELWEIYKQFEWRKNETWNLAVSTDRSIKKIEAQIATIESVEIQTK